MKKNLIKLYCVILVCIIISLFLTVISFRDNGFYGEFKTKEFIEQIQGIEQINKEIRWQAILRLGFTAFFDLMWIFMRVSVTLIIPCSLLLGMGFTQFVATIVQIGESKKWKNITTNIFSCITVILQIVLCIVLLINLKINSNKLLVSLEIIINLVCVGIFVNDIIRIRKVSKKQPEISKEEIEIISQ